MDMLSMIYTNKNFCISLFWKINYQTTRTTSTVCTSSIFAIHYRN